MKKIGMITIYKKNYGAFLQAYALQQTLLKLGHQPEIIRYDYYKDNTVLGVSKDNPAFYKTLLKTALVEAVRYIPHKKRQRVFESSIKKNIIEAKDYYGSYSDLEKRTPCYDVFLVGSDQVFNPLISPQALKARLLCFVKEGIKASFAASAGEGKIPTQFRDIFIHSLKSFDFLSVREAGLVEFLKEEYGIRSVQHNDPVFLLDSNEWGSFENKVAGLPNNYIFYYRVLPQKELHEAAEIISKELNLPIFVADGHDTFNNQIKRNCFLSPEQWVYALNHASYVVTNSFHGASFAVNFKKRATIFIPPKGGERVKNLLLSCHLNSALEQSLIMKEDIDEIYSYAKIFLKDEREKSLNYLISVCG